MNYPGTLKCMSLQSYHWRSWICVWLPFLPFPFWESWGECNTNPVSEVSMIYVQWSVDVIQNLDKSSVLCALINRSNAMTMEARDVGRHGDGIPLFDLLPGNNTNCVVHMSRGRYYGVSAYDNSLHSMKWQYLFSVNNMLIYQNQYLSQRDRVMHICISKLCHRWFRYCFATFVTRSAIIWTNAGIFSIGPLRRNFSEIWIKMQRFSFISRKLLWNWNRQNGHQISKSRDISRDFVCQLFT